jgi:hypothetical protein
MTKAAQTMHAVQGAKAAWLQVTCDLCACAWEGAAIANSLDQGAASVVCTFPSKQVAGNAPALLACITLEQGRSADHACSGTHTTHAYLPCAV